MLGVRLEFTLEKFFEKGGPTVFAHRMAAVLGIHFADIKIVTAYELGASRRMLQTALVGLIVEFEVFKVDAEDDAEQQSFLARVEQKFAEQMRTLTEFMDTPILNASVSG